MPYATQTWTDDATLVDKIHMDHIEAGIVTADANATTALAQSLPQPVVNGQWIKGAGGVPVWSAIAIGDLPFAGQPSGVATLDSGGKVPVAQIPALAGQEISYTQITTGVSITATTAATAQSVINPGAVAYDGTPILIEFFSPAFFTPAVASGNMVMSLWETNTDLGFFAQVINPSATAAALVAPVYVCRRLTPTAGSRNYNVRAYVTGGTGTVQGGVGTIGAYQPMFLRMSRA